MDIVQELEATARKREEVCDLEWQARYQDVSPQVNDIAHTEGFRLTIYLLVPRYDPAIPPPAD